MLRQPAGALSSRAVPRGRWLMHEPEGHRVIEKKAARKEAAV
ncbi:hypothetical protein OPEN69S_03756 [Ottowia pentelensis]